MSKIEDVEKIAHFSKIQRFLHNPYKYLLAVGYRRIIYPLVKREIYKTVSLFYGRSMKIALPASTDIYLTGGKSHDSEIRLAKFLINYLEKGDFFLDIGAHYGYFSLLAADLTGENGLVVAAEPSEKSFKILKENTKQERNINIINQPLSDREKTVTFYQFPNLHSEFNAINIDHFKNKNWYKKDEITKYDIQATTIDHMISTSAIKPGMIKIDVEGGEFDVIKGGISFLEEGNPFIIMEYLKNNDGMETHKMAAGLLQKLDYNSFLITNKGELERINDIEAYLSSKNIQSENIVFKKDLLKT